MLSRITIAGILVSLSGLTATSRGDAPADFVRLMNLGKAHLENRDSKSAIQAFSAAIKLDPKSAPALRNLTRAYLLARKHEEAFVSCKAAAALRTGSAAAQYLLGLTFVRRSRFEEALPYFETAIRLDPHTPALRFQLANAYQAAGKHDQAMDQLHETVRLDPLHSSAHFKLGAYARKAKDREEFQRRTREFMRLRKLFSDQTRTAEALETCVYTQPETVPTAPARDRAKRTPAIEVRFTDVTDKAFTRGGDRSSTAAVIEVDEIGRCTFFVADPGGSFSLMTMSPAGTFQRTPIDLKLSGEPVFSGCAIGDFHDDVPAGVKYDPKVHALSDVVLTGPVGLRLLERTGPKSFLDVTAPAGLTGVKANRARWVDYEHDGDIDLLLAGADGLELWQNNGDGRFENVTALVGIGKTAGVTDVATADLDADVSVDLIAACDTAPTLVFKNKRAGLFAPLPEPPGPWPVAKRILLDDLDNNGYPDAILIQKDQAVVLLGHSTVRHKLDLTGLDVAAATLVDYDNDGWLDFLAVGTMPGSDLRGIVRLYRNVATGFIDVSESTGLATMPTAALRDVIAADVDADGDTDILLITSEGKLRLLRNDGGHLNGQLKIRLTTLKTNPTGIGTHIELRHGDFWVTRSVTKWPIEIGLAGHQRLESLQTLWTNGVVDNQIDVPLLDEQPGTGSYTKTLTILEKNVAAGSCPFLYAWDGTGFRFVTDLLGNSPIGLPLRRDVMLTADPDEIVLIGDADLFPPRDGAYTVVVSDEFREILYLDQAKLIAVDHPSAIEVHPTDRLMPPPFPPSQVWALGSPARLMQALGDDGTDRTAAVRAIDGAFAPPGLPLPSPYRGMCHPLTLTLDFGPLESARPLVLALTGWLQYGDASTNIALSQNSALTIIPPTLEVERARGAWQPVDVTVGMPAGKTKTILCDLTGKLPRGARRLRLTTTFEIRWDRIALFERLLLPDSGTRLSPHRGPYRYHEQRPIGGELRWRGFSEIKSRQPGHATTPDFNVVRDRPSWRTALQGWCTRYGDVLELVTERDDRLVILSAGDALTLRFDATTFPPLPDGYLRTFFFYAVGWDKDGDHNVTGGATIAPLPTSRRPSTALESDFQWVIPDTLADDDEADWRLQYNTRWVPRNRFGREHY